jgi:hypothetical protein
MMTLLRGHHESRQSRTIKKEEAAGADTHFHYYFVLA